MRVGSDLASPAGKRLRLSLGLMLMVAGGLLAAAWPKTPPGEARVLRARYLMGTVLEIDAVGRDRTATEEAVATAFREVERAEERLSNWRVESELSRANRQASLRPFPLSPETFASLHAALALAQETEGAFDPTVGAVTEALGLTGQPPDPGRVRSSRQTVGWRKVSLDPANRTLFFEVPGAAIDAGGFGKGEALDRAVAALRKKGVVTARLNFGGQISLLGTGAPEGRKRHFGRVAIAVPDASGRELMSLESPDGSISTSGVSERPGHILDPRTGEAAAFQGSVTVVSDFGLRADALSTALFVLGPHDGLTFADRWGIAALYVVPSNNGFELQASRAFPRSRTLAFSRRVP